MKASSSVGDSCSSGCSGSESGDIDTAGSTNSEDMSGMKLGPWFNGKNHTMNKNTSLVFPTAVYLENLEKSKKSESRDKRSDEEEIIAAASATGSEAGEASLSSFDNIRYNF